MKKIKSFIKNKVAILTTCTFAIMMLLGCATVLASSYTSYLIIGNGSTVIGGTRYYTAGTNTIDISVDGWTNYGNKGYTKLKTTLMRDNGNSSTQLGSSTNKISSTGFSIYNNYGYQAASNKYYTFTTYINGVVYGGVTSNSIIMQS